MRSAVLAAVLLAVVVAVVAWWSAGVGASCEDQGGVMVWEVDRAASTSYGWCDMTNGRP